MNTDCRVRLIKNNDVLLELYSGIDGDPAFIGKKILEYFIRQTPLNVEKAVSIMNKLQNDFLEGKPPFLNEQYQTDYTYEIILDDDTFTVLVQEYNLEPDTIYCEEYMKYKGKKWKHVALFNEEILAQK